MITYLSTETVAHSGALLVTACLDDSFYVTESFYGYSEEQAMDEFLDHHAEHATACEGCGAWTWETCREWCLSWEEDN